MKFNKLYESILNEVGYSKAEEWSKKWAARPKTELNRIAKIRSLIVDDPTEKDFPPLEYRQIVLDIYEKTIEFFKKHSEFTDLWKEIKEDQKRILDIPEEEFSVRDESLLILIWNYRNEDITMPGELLQKILGFKKIYSDEEIEKVAFSK